MSASIAFQGELQFRRYSDTSAQGQQVVFAVADREALEPFIGKEGKRFMAVLVEIGDDEQPVQPEPKKERANLGPLCREAVGYCEMPEFREWLGLLHKRPFGELDARAWLLEHCGISSRKELDTDAAAAEHFIHEYRIPFMRWMKSRSKREEVAA